MDRLEEIFQHKNESSRAFRLVQEKHGLLATPDIPVDPLTREGAIELHKGLHWINLELSEFLGSPYDEKPEELADVLHFLVEFCLLSAIDHGIIPEADLSTKLRDTDRLEVMLSASANDPFVFPDADTNSRFAILASLQIAEMLKNKPWKQTLKTEFARSEFEKRVRALFYWYGATVRTFGMTAQQLFDEFMRKEKINYERISTGV